jgi:Lipid-droplet associated hydrolase
MFPLFIVIVLLGGLYYWLSIRERRMSKYAFRGSRNFKVLGDVYPTEILTYRPTKGSNNQFKIVIIPGNPGYIDFYDSFILSLYSLFSEKIEIEIISHAGHTKSSHSGNNQLFDLE